MCADVCVLQVAQITVWEGGASRLDDQTIWEVGRRLECTSMGLTATERRSGSPCLARAWDARRGSFALSNCRSPPTLSKPSLRAS